MVSGTMYEFGFARFKVDGYLDTVAAPAAPGSAIDYARASGSSTLALLE
ncbi:MAG: hypothetical protein WBV82_21695 [Myxococcaceae bacterium]